MGASPFFPPQSLTAEAAAQAIQMVIQHSPRQYGLERSRWWLAGLRDTVGWLKGCSLSGIYGLLARLKVRYKRGRRYVHSPDEAYDAKMELVALVRELAEQDPQRFAYVYQDELTYYRRPTVAQGYALQGTAEPLARQGLRSNLYRRIAGSLDGVTGRLFCWQREHFDRFTLIRYYHALDASYPSTLEALFVIQDNWPVHLHEDIFHALADTRLYLVPLPTYAPWTNPIEKVWRRLYQEILHLHEFVDRWDDLQTEVQHWLDKYTTASPDLLHYVGLCPD